MNVDEIINKNKLLEEELQKTKDELIQTKEHLKQYTAPISRKIYYEKNKEKEKQRAKEAKTKKNVKGGKYNSNSKTRRRI